MFHVGLGTRTAELLRSRVAAGHGVDEVVWSVVAAAGGTGDVGFAVAAVIADRGVAQGSEDSGPGAGAGPVGVFTECDVRGCSGRGSRCATRGGPSPAGRPGGPTTSELRAARLSMPTVSRSDDRKSCRNHELS